LQLVHAEYMKQPSVLLFAFVKGRFVQLTPRKTPKQFRSKDTVEAIRIATIQVLLAVGQEQLTTTLVSQRAGVSVGTLYQYYPNKQSLLAEVVRSHLERVLSEVEAAVQPLGSPSDEQLATVLTGAYLDAKFTDPDTSRALYRVADDLQVKEVVLNATVRLHALIASALRSVSTMDEAVLATRAFAIGALLSGVTRAMFESDDWPADLDSLREELRLMVLAYLGCRENAAERANAPA
jgi:AcrR family transcriptional regulator